MLGNDFLDGKEKKEKQNHTRDSNEQWQQKRQKSGYGRAWERKKRDSL